MSGVKALAEALRCFCWIADVSFSWLMLSFLSHIHSLERYREFLTFACGLEAWVLLWVRRQAVFRWITFQIKTQEHFFIASLNSIHDFKLLLAFTFEKNVDDWISYNAHAFWEKNKQISRYVEIHFWMSLWKHAYTLSCSSYKQNGENVLFVRKASSSTKELDVRSTINWCNERINHFHWTYEHTTSHQIFEYWDCVGICIFTEWRFPTNNYSSVPTVKKSLWRSCGGGEHISR